MCGAALPLLNMPPWSDAKSYRSNFVYLQSFKVKMYKFAILKLCHGTPCVCVEEEESRYIISLFEGTP
jgi:hypothetical protein